MDSIDIDSVDSVDSVDSLESVSCPLVSVDLLQLLLAAVAGARLLATRGHRLHLLQEQAVRMLEDAVRMLDDAVRMEDGSLLNYSWLGLHGLGIRCGVLEKGMM